MQLAATVSPDDKVRKPGTLCSQNMRSEDGWPAHSLVVGCRRTAEASLKNVERTAGFPVLLLKLVSMETAGSEVRLAGALFFKNFVKRHWVVEVDSDAKDVKTGGASAAAAASAPAGVDAISAADRNVIKQHLVALMLTASKKVSAPPRSHARCHCFSAHDATRFQLKEQLAEALAIISKTDFPKKWPTLMPVCLTFVDVVNT